MKITQEPVGCKHCLGSGKMKPTEILTTKIFEICVVCGGSGKVVKTTYDYGNTYPGTNIPNNLIKPSTL